MRLRKKLAENRSPNSIAIELNEKADINLKSIELNDEPSNKSFNDIVIDSVAVDSNESDRIDDCIVDTANALQLNGSKADFEIHNEGSNEVLSTLSQQNEGIDPLSDISGQCLNTATLSIDKNQIISNGNKKHSTFGGTLDLTSKEFIDMNTQNVLNICLSDVNVKASKPNTKKKPIIQVLSESSCSNLLETTNFEASNEFGLNGRDCMDNIGTPLELNVSFQSTDDGLIDETTEKQTVETNFVEKIEEKSKPIPNPSSAITFYCENLDDLKEIGSDSDVNIEEI